LARPLSDLRPNESGVITEIHGGKGLLNRLGALGIIPGRRVTKISSMFMRGPITVQVNRSQIALGFRMASNILVDVDRTTQ